VNLSELVVPDWAMKLITGALIALLLGGCVAAIHHWGVTDERTRQTALDNTKLIQYGKQILDLQTKNRADERANVLAMNQLTIDYEKRLSDAKDEKDAVLHDVELGKRKLYIATKSAVQACSSGSTQAGAITITPDETRAELSQTASDFLVGFASDCDTTAEKLNLAIDIATKDRIAPSLEAR